MGTEIERKFLVRDDRWRAQIRASAPIKQGYLHADPKLAVRVRVHGDQGVLTIKGPSQGISRAEFEYPIPLEDAEQLLRDLCLPGKVEKVRHLVIHEGARWEIDVFEGENAGLVVAELELESEHQAFERPAWLGEEVSRDGRYLNAQLALRPYSSW